MTSSSVTKVSAIRLLALVWFTAIFPSHLLIPIMCSLQCCPSFLLACFITLYVLVPDDPIRQVSIQSKAELPLTLTTSINLVWSPDIQPFVDPDSYKVDIAAYILDAKNGKLERGKVVAEDLPNSGTATITLKDVHLMQGVVVVPLYIQVAVAGSLDQRGDLQNKASSWSAVTYFTTRTALSFACRQWSSSQRSFNGSQLLDQVEPCPRTVAQAQLPNSNFIQDDADPFGRHIQEARVFHPGADVCFRQRVPQYVGVKPIHTCKLHYVG